MSHLRTKLQEINDKIRSVDIDQCDRDEVDDFHSSQEELLSQIILEEGMLNGSIWKIIDFNEKVLLRSIVPDNLINKLLFDSRVEALYIMPGVLYYLGNYPEIMIDNVDSDLIPFIKKYGIIIDPTGVLNHLKRLRRGIRAYETICHMFNIK